MDTEIIDDFLTAMYVTKQQLIQTIKSLNANEFTLDSVCKDDRYRSCIGNFLTEFCALNYIKKIKKHHYKIIALPNSNVMHRKERLKSDYSNLSAYDKIRIDCFETIKKELNNLLQLKGNARLSLEHCEPLVKGGKNSPDNIMLLTIKHNNGSGYKGRKRPSFRQQKQYCDKIMLASEQDIPDNKLEDFRNAYELLMKMLESVY